MKRSLNSQNLPARVKAAIRLQEERSEILIGWVQLSLVAIWATLYTLAPKTFEQSSTLEPVPFALSGYAAFTIIRLVLAYKRRLPGWLVAASIVLDVALLMALIWSFHVQYDQPASFYLKAPTLLYAFIFIALRALRFDPRFVLMAGVVAAIGWLVLVAYAVFDYPADKMLTRDYVAYLTDNRILLGAEFDKVLTILMVTVILAVALTRARRLLVEAVAEGSVARELRRFFAPEVADRIALSETALTAGHGEAREATILMVDLRDFTGLSSTMPPDAVVRLLADYQARVVPVIRAHGGSVDKFLGDGIMATFGAVLPSDTHAADALLAADAVLEAVARWSAERVAAGHPPIMVNCALAAGSVVVGAVGDTDRLEFTVIGTPVNLAAKLEKHAKTERALTLTTTETVAAAASQGWQPPPGMDVRQGRTVDGVASALDLAIIRSWDETLATTCAPAPSPRFSA